MACNPPCSAEEQCTAQGECKPREAATSSEFVTVSADAPMPEKTADDASWQERPTRRKSTGMMVTGIVLAGAGGLVALSGLPFLLMGDARECDTWIDGSQDCYGTDYTPIGRGMVIGGLVVAAIGIPFIVIGAERVPAGSSGVTVRLATGPSQFALSGTW
jgi:hypothetical protein